MQTILLSDLRASHLSTVGDSVVVERKDGELFVVEVGHDLDGRFYRAMHFTQHGTTFRDSVHSATSKKLREVVREVRDAVVPTAGHTPEELAQHEKTLAEFPDFDTVLPVIVGMDNWSWHNDLCPKLGAELPDGYRIELSCDYADKSKREFPDEEHPQWLLYVVTGDDEELLQEAYDHVPADLHSRAMAVINDHRADAARKAITDAASTYEDSAAYDFRLPLSCAAFLATRKYAPSICAAMGVTPEDCVIEEAEEGGDISGWTYVDGHGSDVYMAQYPNGKVGAELGGYQIYADTLEEAERQLCAYVECTDVTGLPNVYAVAESKLDTAAAQAVLTLVYAHWLREQGHPLEGCAYELLIANAWTDTDERLTDEQRLFVFKFNEAWDAA